MNGKGHGNGLTSALQGFVVKIPDFAEQVVHFGATLDSRRTVHSVRGGSRERPGATSRVSGHVTEAALPPGNGWEKQTRDPLQQTTHLKQRHGSEARPAKGEEGRARYRRRRACLLFFSYLVRFFLFFCFAFSSFSFASLTAQTGRRLPR